MIQKGLGMDIPIQQIKSEKTIYLVNIVLGLAIVFIVGNQTFKLDEDTLKVIDICLSLGLIAHVIYMTVVIHTCMQQLKLPNDLAEPNHYAGMMIALLLVLFGFLGYNYLPNWVGMTYTLAIFSVIMSITGGLFLTLGICRFFMKGSK